MTTRTAFAWHDQAACAETDPNLWFNGHRTHQQKAKALCRGCPVQATCLQDALSHGESEQWWVAGGMTAAERRQLLKSRRPAGEPLRAAHAAIQTRSAARAAQIQRLTEAGWSADAIAEQLGTTSGAIYQARSKARRSAA